MAWEKIYCDTNYHINIYFTYTYNVYTHIHLYTYGNKVNIYAYN